MEKESKNIKMSFPRHVVGNLPLSASLLKEEKQPFFNGKVEDPRTLRAAKHSGMTTLSYNGTKAFTLIELLVVVLIIGILAAVAVPQYQQAVLKSRVQPYMTLLKTLITAKHTHYLATGQYTYDVNLLDVEMPSSCWETGGGSVGQLWSCGKDFHIDNTGGGIIFYYCPGKNSTHAECMENKELQFAVAQTMAGFGSCAGYTERGRNFCKSFRQLFASY